MKSKFLKGVVAVLTLTASGVCYLASAETANKDGQYFCFVEHAAGIQIGDKEKNEPTFSGSIKIPEGDQKFFIKVGPITRDQFETKICEESFNYYATEFLQKGIPYSSEWNTKFYHRSFIGQTCFASSEVKLTFTGDSKQLWTYRGYGNYQYYGFDPRNWFQFNDDNSFMLGFVYDRGPVIEYGNCTKIEPPKQ